MTGRQRFLLEQSQAEIDDAIAENRRELPAREADICHLNRA